MNSQELLKGIHHCKEDLLALLFGTSLLFPLVRAGAHPVGDNTFVLPFTTAAGEERRYTSTVLSMWTRSSRM